MLTSGAMHQIDLFEDVLAVYGQHDRLSNAQLYAQVARRSGVPQEYFDKREAIGRAGAQHSPLKRKVRWYQQTLKTLGLLEGANERGVWKLTQAGRKKLTPAAEHTALLGFSTELGVALWSRCETAFPALNEPINLVLSSLPYPLNRPRAYGNVSEIEYVDWVCSILEPVIAQLAQGASVVLNVGHDIFMPGSPARSMYRERLMLALHDRFGLFKMDDLIWHNPARPPGPLQWASLSRQQLNASWEPLHWLTNDPAKCKADNRRVLQPHTEQHLKLMARGGEQRATSYGDGAHSLREGSYGRMTEGRIPRNVISMSHNCQHKREMAALAKAAGLPVHGATMPLKLARFVIEFLTEKDDLVVDPCGGWFNTAKAAEELGRRWFATEKMGEYVLGGALGFRQAKGFEMFGALA